MFKEKNRAVSTAVIPIQVKTFFLFEIQRASIKPVIKGDTADTTQVVTVFVKNSGIPSDKTHGMKTAILLFDERNKTEYTPDASAAKINAPFDKKDRAVARTRRHTVSFTFNGHGFTRDNSFLISSFIVILLSQNRYVGVKDFARKT